MRKRGPSLVASNNVIPAAFRGIDDDFGYVILM